MMSALESCRWTRTQLPRFLDCELPEDLSARVSIHLERCSGCRDALATERDALIETISALVPAEPPLGMLDAVMAEIENEPARGAETVAPAATPVVRLPSFLPGLAAAALLGFVLWAIPGETVPSGPDTENRVAKVDKTDRAPRGNALDSEIETSIGIAPALASGDTRAPVMTGSSNESVRGFLTGDVNQNGVFEQGDLREINRYLDSGGDLACLAAGDFDEDGALTLQDSSLALMAFGTAESSTSRRLFDPAADNSLTCAFLACP